ncbi:MAG: LamG domain-containing protein, partial [Deltaproteobacteria bacterium]|nr:LamG domain-containing protein [Deltaproteobacteria bacterium]
TGRYDAVLNGDPQWQPADGKAAGALQFDGIFNYLSTDFVLNPAHGQFSLFAWIKGAAPGQVVIAQTDGVNWLSANPSEGSLMTELKGSARSSKPLQSQTVITDGNWHHIGIVWDGYSRMLYVDGINVAQDEQNILEGNQSGLCIGAGVTLEAASFFSGLIDDICIYDIAMRTEQIEAIAR